jgi:hypothetical protein
MDRRIYKRENLGRKKGGLLFNKCNENNLFDARPHPNPLLFGKNSLGDSHIEPLNRSSRRKEAPSKFPEIEFEPPNVGCYEVQGEGLRRSLRPPTVSRLDVLKALK